MTIIGAPLPTVDATVASASAPTATTARVILFKTDPLAGVDWVGCRSGCSTPHTYANPSEGRGQVSHLDHQLTTPKRFATDVTFP